MKKIEINGGTYRLPNKLNDFQLKLFIHLIDWKWSKITKDAGYFKGEQYDAILPKSEHANLPHIYDSLKDALTEHLNVFPFKLHPHFYHMASSQAANINLFLPILQHPAVNDILKQLKPDFKCLATDELYHGYRLEFWDGNSNKEKGNLGDHTAVAGTDSDIGIAYYNNDDKLCLWLIEHKLREDEFTECGGCKSKGRNKTKHLCEKSFNDILEKKQLCYYHDANKYKYWDITEENKDFYVKANEFNTCPFKRGMNQLWRNQLLGFALEKQGKYKEVYFSVVRHPENDLLTPTIEEYRRLVSNSPKFSDFTSKDVVEAVAKIDDMKLKKWKEWYSELYMIN